MQKPFIQIHPEDNILVAIEHLGKGMSIEHQSISLTLNDDIAAKHKFSLVDISEGSPVIMYGGLVGKAVKDISQGDPITVKNIVHASAEYSIGHQETMWDSPVVDRWADATFRGYHRNDGKVGTANYWLVIPLVFCENRNIDLLKRILNKALGYAPIEDSSNISIAPLIEAYQQGSTIEELLQIPLQSKRKEHSIDRVFPNVDGIKFLNHDGGCGGIRQDAEVLCRLLAGYLAHPNVGGATVLSLGCQNAQISLLETALKDIAPDFDKPLFVLEQQQSDSERDFMEQAARQTFQGLIQVNKVKREPAPLHHLTLGLECGGSDGFSGISANPVLGHTTDLLVALGGTAILSEFPELNGVEQALVNRCQQQQDAEKFVDLMRRYSARAEAVGSGFDSNPSPGNIKDGLITDAMKSAGAAKKGGTSPVVAVLDYADQVRKNGLNLLCTPGNDVESTTGLVGSGANLVCFTTGLGTPTGNPIAPVIKISSNNRLARKMADIIDFNTGGIVTGEETIENKGMALLDYIIQVASGEHTTAAQRLQQDDFIPWKRGISL